MNLGNGYAYAASNPIANTDPTGEWAIVIAAAAGCLGVGGAGAWHSENHGMRRFGDFAAGCAVGGLAGAATVSGQPSLIGGSYAMVGQYMTDIHDDGSVNDGYEYAGAAVGGSFSA